MRKLLLPFAVGLTALVLVAACSKDYFTPDTYEFRQRWAVPLVSASLSVADIINADQNEVVTNYAFTSGEDSVFYLSLNYSDTLEQVNASDFGATGGSIPGGIPFPIGEREILLRLFGQFDGGEFTLVNPTLEFVFINDMETDFNLYINDTKTRLQEDGTVEYPFTINGQPLNIAAGTPASPVTSTFVVDNSNVTPSDALTQIFEPTPKYLYYSPVIETGTGTANLTGSKLDVVTNVELPLEGYGYIEYTDTLPYDFIDSIAIIGMDFLTMRINITNGLPMQAEISGTVVDTADNYKVISDLPMYEQDGTAAEFTRAVIGGATNTSSSTSPTTASNQVISDITIFDKAPTDNDMDLAKLAAGNAIILNIRLETTGFDGPTPVQIFSDQTLDVKIGMKAGIGASGEELLDIITSSDSM